MGTPKTSPSRKATAAKAGAAKAAGPKAAAPKVIPPTPVPTSGPPGTSAHLICKSGANITRLKDGGYRSGVWDVPEADAGALVGGTLMFHETKAAPSYFGGTVTAYRTVEAQGPRPGGIEFDLTSTVEARKQGWRGAKQAVSLYSGLVETPVLETPAS